LAGVVDAVETLKAEHNGERAGSAGVILWAASVVLAAILLSDMAASLPLPKL
jgi:hypothetical protein